MGKGRRTVLVTGAATGIGRAAAELFSRQGDRVVLHYHQSHKDAMALLDCIEKRGGEAMAYQADVADLGAVSAMVDAAQQRFGTVDVLVNNAGIAQQKLFTDITPAEWDRMMAVHVTGAFNTCRSVVPGMISKKRGAIINVSSIWGMVGASCEVHYSTAKAALIGMTRALAKELGPSGICVNCVAPGVIDTRMNDDLDEETRDYLKEQTPLLRLGTPQEVAACIHFLASQDAAFVTGQILSPNGGFVI